MITELTSEQEALIPVYRDKWRKIDSSIDKINRKKAAKSGNKVYTLNGLSEPEIIFLDSPCAAISESWFKTWIEPRGEIDSYLSNQFRIKIDNNIDIEPIYLLKMTCPSTGRIHALRVPPDINSARDAIRWINWGTNKSGIFCANIASNPQLKRPF